MIDTLSAGTKAVGDADGDEPRRPLRSKHTSNFPALLGGLGASVAVTTYQAGKLVLLRADGGAVNTSS